MNHDRRKSDAALVEIKALAAIMRGEVVYVTRTYKSIMERQDQSHRENREEHAKLWKHNAAHSGERDDTAHATLDRKIDDNEKAINKIGGMGIILGLIWGGASALAAFFLGRHQ